jgi:hypothetical protein
MSTALTGLTSATTPLDGTESIYVVQGGNSRKATTGNLYIPGGTDVAVADGGTGASTASGARSNLGLVIGTDVQAHDADLDAIAALSTTTYGRSLLTLSAAEDVRNSIDAAPYVATRTALKALDTTKDTTAFLTEAGREGIFMWKAGDYSAQVTADTQEGVYVKATAIASSAGAWVRVYSRLTVEYFGASTSATATANTTAIQAAVNFAQSYTGYLYFPALYSINGTISVSNNIVLEGVSAFTSGITTTTGAAISLVPSTLISNNNTWYGIRYLSIISTDVGAHYGIEYASTGSEYLSNWELVGSYLSGTSGGASFDSTGSTVGIFSCTIRRNWFNNGLVIKDGGDSITFVENTVNGNGIGLLVNALKTGARQLVIRNNNFSALSECVYLLSVSGAFVDSNWMETPSYLGSYTGTTGSLMYAQACSNCQITRNTIQPLASVGGGFVPAAYAIRLNTSGAFNVISMNQLIAIGGTGHIQIGGSVTSTYIDWNNNFDVTAVITDAGTGTFGAGSSPGVFKQLVSFQTATQFTATVQALCTDSGTGNGPYYEVYRQKSAGAANDGLGGFLWYGSNSAGTKTNYGYITHTILTATAASEAGQFNIARMVGGALTIGFTLGATFAFTTGGTFNGTITPLSNAGGALGSASLQWSNAFLATGGVINFNNGNYTVTHSAGILTFSGAVLFSGGVFGYTTGAGGTVTQATSRTTGVTLNKLSGQITTNTTSLAAASTAKFTVTNSTVTALDTVVVSIASGSTTDQTDVKVQRVAAGAFDIVVANRHASTAETGAIVINYNVIRGASA